MKLESEILALTRAGTFSQEEIARALGVHRNHVYAVRKKHGLAGDRPGIRCPKLPVAKILRALRTKSRSKVAVQFGTTVHRVKRIAEQNGIRPRAHITPELRQKIADAIIRKSDHAPGLAMRHRVGQKFVLKIAHQELGDAPFRTGVAEPFTSDFPQKDLYQQGMTPEDFVDAVMEHYQWNFSSADDPKTLAGVIVFAITENVPEIRDSEPNLKAQLTMRLYKAFEARLNADAAQPWVN